jgi:hypothetical protein
MDSLAHGLWAYLAAQVLRDKQKRVLTKRERIGAIVSGVMPDLVAFIPGFIIGGTNIISYAYTRFLEVWGITSTIGEGVVTAAPVVPAIVGIIYNYSHSGLLWVIIAGVLYITLKRLPLWWLGWGTHIALDVFTHDAAHFPTKLLHPFSEFHINATAWSDPVVLGCTYVALLVCYLAVYHRRQKSTP